MIADKIWILTNTCMNKLRKKQMTPDDVNDQIEENIGDKVFFMSEIEVLDELMMHGVHYAVHAEDLKDERFMEEAREELCTKLLEEYQSRY